MRRQAGALLLVGGLGIVSLLGYAAGVPWLVAASPRPHVAHIGLFGALFLIYLLATCITLRRSHTDPLLVGLVLGFGLLFRLSLLGSPVLLSSDLYRYLWDGRVQWAGISPYRYAPAAPELAPLRDEAVHPHINRPTKPTVYPPGAQAVFALVARAVPDSIPAWRSFLLACDVVTGGLLLALLRRMGAPPAAVVVYAWSPLVVFEGVQAGHVDLAVIPLVLAALLWRQAGSSVRAGIALGGAVLLKLYPIVLLPVWWRPRDWRFPATVAATVALGYLPHAAGVGLGALGFLPEYLGRAEDHNIGLRALLTYPLGLTGEVGRATVMALLFALMAAVLIGIRRARGDEPAAIARAGTLAVGTYLLLVPTSMHPWYVLWIVPFLCVSPSPPWLFFSGAVVLSYMSYVVEPAPIPWWAWLAEYGPLYALLMLSGIRALARQMPAVVVPKSLSGNRGAPRRRRGATSAGGLGGPGARPPISLDMTPLDVVVGLLYLVAVVALFLYGLNAYVLLAIHWWNRRRIREARPPAPPAEWPSVTVQLPIYNERYVARRLLEAMGALDYPADRLEIQVLDDSTDDTTAIIAQTASRLRERGLHVVHLHRRERTGFKAGALAAGLKEARGEFLAIFDADSVPAPDFLYKTLPHFAQPKVAVVQTRWGHLNREFSLLTVAQSLAIDGHFAVEQSARCWGNLLLNFNGTAGVWRRAAIEDAGGWTHDTLTEDLDLSYRAQLRGWRIVYRPDLVCPAELPVVITGFKSQQRRWAKGSIQTALKLLPAILRARLSPWTKYQAFVHLTYYMIHPAMLTVALLSVPLLWAEGLAPEGSVLLAVSLTSSLGFLGPGLLLVYAQHVLDPGWRRRVWRLPTIMVIGVGVAWSTSLAVLGAFWRKDLEFVRTPKFGIGPAGGHWRGKAYRDRRPRGGLIEIALGLYCAWSGWLFWVHQNYSALPFLALYTSGFLTVGVLTVLHAIPGRGDRSRRRDDAAAPG